MHQSSATKGTKRSRKSSESDSEDSGSDLPSVKVSENAGGKRRDPIDLRVAIENDAVDNEAKGLASWKMAHAGASSMPGRHMCVICGYFSNYKCVECATKRISQMQTYVCGNRCLEIHKNHNCGRGIPLDVPRESEAPSRGAPDGRATLAKCIPALLNLTISSRNSAMDTVMLRLLDRPESSSILMQ
ncbi:SEY1 [Babesia ovis]|uniref:SEY1 n=1 Tax=Babesia ovis TaxID=5869 RepID=A0A9W5TCZ4_BABOV|nr:SEY1 [Babesia ovis]